MKIAFILTPFNQLKSAGFTTNKVKRVYGYSIPLGIANLAAVLEEAGEEVCVLDPCPNQLSTPEIVDYIRFQQPDIIGISVMTHVAPNAYALADELKKEFPHTPIIMGGSHCTIFPERVLTECSAVDVVVIGEGEERIVPIVRTIFNNGDLNKINGLIFRGSDNQIIYTGPPEVQKNLDPFPFPARHLFDNKLYIPFPDQLNKLPATNIMASRGCTWRKCKFCFEGGKYMPHYRRRSPENVIEELKEIKRMGFNAVAFWDDNFCISEKWVLKFCQLLKQSNLDLVWTCYGRADTTTEKMLYEIKSAGCYSLYIGFESGNQEVLDMINKGTTLEQARKIVRVCNKIKLQVRGSFILGLPGDTPQLAKNSIKFARELNLDFVKFMLYTPEQGTALYDLALQKGTIVNQGFLGSLTKATYVPNGYESAEQLERIAQRANIGYVLRPRFIAKKICSIRKWEDFRKLLDGFFMMISLRRSLIYKKVDYRAGDSQA